MGVKAAWVGPETVPPAVGAGVGEGVGLLQAANKIDRLAIRVTIFTETPSKDGSHQGDGTTQRSGLGCSSWVSQTGRALSPIKAARQSPAGWSGNCRLVFARRPSRYQSKISKGSTTTATSGRRRSAKW